MANRARSMTDLVNNPDSNERNILINKLLGIYIHIVLDAPLMRQNAGIQTALDNMP